MHDIMERVWAILILILYVKGRLEDRVSSFDVCFILFAKLGKNSSKISGENNSLLFFSLVHIY